MAFLYKNGTFLKDRWRSIAVGEGLPPSGHVILPLDWWQAEREAFSGSDGPLGVRIEPDTPLKAFSADVLRFALIAVVFENFEDGRPFSMARLLRQRLGFNGELPAVGDVQFDEMQLMRRCGFDAFEIGDSMTVRLLRHGRRGAFKHFYQAQTDPKIPAGAGPQSYCSRSE